MHSAGKIMSLHKTEDFRSVKGNAISQRGVSTDTATGPNDTLMQLISLLGQKTKQ